jgi:hypothetical protein
MKLFFFLDNERQIVVTVISPYGIAMAAAMFV